MPLSHAECASAR
ncbi:hypothetical protein Q9966_011487 [Columba livia]|nr:hypothetical protein Q9966_011487 [Columba livia]